MTPRLRILLSVVFALFAIIGVNSVYLISITMAGVQFQDYFYQWMFLLHLVLGIAIVLPVIVFGIAHMLRGRSHPNRRAMRVGYALLVVSLVLLGTGFVLLTRADGAFAEHAPALRSSAYWAHVLAPLVVIWLFVLHRLAGPRIKWRIGAAWATVTALFAGGMLLLQTHDPRAWNVAGNPKGEAYFFPSLARTSTGDFIAAGVLHNDAYCVECHADIHQSWEHSVHRFSSFNNPPYLFSVQETRRVMLARDGNVQGSRFCAGCHDPVPFFSGAFDHPKFDDPEYDLASDPTAQAGITCTVCHSIVHVGNTTDGHATIGNADYTIEEPIHYPFTFSDNSLLRWVNRQLVKSKPAFHKATFLKPLHKTSQFCGSCHKVHLPVELNAYKWLRGQNHYDAFYLSGVSGHGISSFYYPPKAQPNCNECHMPLREVTDGVNFAARVRDDSGLLKTLDHQFPSANTAIPHLVRDQLEDADGAIAAHAEFMNGVMRVDLFGLKEGGTIDGRLHAPMRPEVPTLTPGETYLLETVIRTVKMGHVFTQGTADSNEVWLDITVRTGDRVIGRMGGMHPKNREVDRWSHFVNSFVLDREGNRINRRNAQDIFVALYNNQIPPGAADVVHSRFTLPSDASTPVTINVALRFRKFDTEYMQLVTGEDDYVNDLPILTLAEDSITFPVEGTTHKLPVDQPTVETWERWNDYGIGLLRKGGSGELRHARRAFEEVEALGRPDGPLNLARVYIAEGLVQTDAPEALERAAAFDPSANEWSLLWFGAEVASQNGDYDRAISNLREIVRGGFEQARGRNFDFSKDYRVRNALGNALYQRSLFETGDERVEMMHLAQAEFETALRYDPENLTAHWGLKQVFQDLGDTQRATHHAAQHAKYKPDDNASDYAVSRARLKYPAANYAADDIVIYDLQRPGAYELPSSATNLARVAPQ